MSKKKVNKLMKKLNINKNKIKKNLVILNYFLTPIQINLKMIKISI